MKMKNSKWMDLEFFRFQKLIPPVCVLPCVFKSCAVLPVCVCILCLSMSTSEERLRKKKQREERLRKKTLRQRHQQFIQEDAARNVVRRENDRQVIEKAAEQRLLDGVKAQVKKVK